jgi:hypothetical protein
VLEPLRPAIEQPPPRGHGRGRRAFQPVESRLDRPVDRAQEAVPRGLELEEQRGAVGPHGLRGVRRRVRAVVGDEIGERDVGLVADARDDGDTPVPARLRDGALVERPQVLQRAAAAAEDDGSTPWASMRRIAAAISFAAAAPCTAVCAKRTG